MGSALPHVGKSLVASNLAVAIAGLGRQVVLVDLDLRTPRQHRLLGITPPDDGIGAWLDKKRRRIDQTPAPTRVRNLRILPCADPRAAPLDAETRKAIVNELYDVEADVVVIDIGSDNRSDILDFFSTRALRLVASSREESDLQATYALLANAAMRARHRHGAGAAAVLAQFRGALVGNSMAEPEEEETFHAFSRLVREHLGIPLPVAGCLQSSLRLAQSIASRQPLVSRRGVDENVRMFHRMAEQLMIDPEVSATDQGCALDVGAGVLSPLPSAPAPLPAPLRSYERRHLRFPVDWMATLDLGTGATAVRVRDISESGAGIETPLPLRLGDRAVLHLDQLADQPALSVVVKNIVAPLGRVGLGFVGAGSTAARVVGLAKKTT